MTEYKYEYYSTFEKWPNTNIIQFEKNSRKRILFGLKKSTEYEYKYYSVWKKQILFSLKKAAEYEYYSVWKNWPNTNTNIIQLEKITRIRIRILLLGLNYSNNIQILNYSLTSASHGGHHHIIHGVPHTNVIRFEEKSWPMFAYPFFKYLHLTTSS